MFSPNAAGSLPGDLHKLWRSRHPKSYHMEYGYSCMGYEVAGGMGVKMAAPDREIFITADAELADPISDALNRWITSVADLSDTEVFAVEGVKGVKKAARASLSTRSWTRAMMRDRGNCS